MSLFEDGRIHFRNTVMKGLKNVTVTMSALTWKQKPGTSTTLVGHRRGKIRHLSPCKPSLSGLQMNWCINGSSILLTATYCKCLDLHHYNPICHSLVSHYIDPLPEYIFRTVYIGSTRHYNFGTRTHVRPTNHRSRCLRHTSTKRGCISMIHYTGTVHYRMFSPGQGRHW